MNKITLKLALSTCALSTCLLGSSLSLNAASLGANNSLSTIIDSTPVLSSSLHGNLGDNLGSRTAEKNGRVIHVNMVVMQQNITYNRLGAHLPNAQLYALTRDVIPSSTGFDANGNDIPITVDPASLQPGKVRLRSDKRPRPIVLRANEGDSLVLHLRNLLPTQTTQPTCDITDTSLFCAGAQIMGLQWADDGNATRIPPGSSHTYRYVANKEGVFMLFSPNNSSFSSSQLDYGLFGSVNVQPREAEWYRSQVTNDDLQLATYTANANLLLKVIAAYIKKDKYGLCSQFIPGSKIGLPEDTGLRQKLIREGDKLICPSVTKNTVWELRIPTLKNGETAKISEVKVTNNGHLNTLAGHPIMNYQAVYPASHTRAGMPVLNMLAPSSQYPGQQELVHSDLTAIITGPNAGRFPYYLDSPSFRENPATPDRRQPYREFSIMYHIATNTKQAFPELSSGPLSNMLSAGKDAFSINYGIGGISAEILANRLGKGPMGINGDEVDLKFEEFFLSSWAVGDPGMVVDIPANSPGGKRATKALFPDDPSNVYHSYMRDHVKYRVINAGSVAPHVHHQHAHQWLHSADSDDGHYLDSQMINPGSAYTLEMTYNGSGNRNQTVGDSIFHCHFYPHFAQGMWGLWRVHDVFEKGTELTASNHPINQARALPDGEIIKGTAIPALVPMPTLAMAPVPAEVQLTDNGRSVYVAPESTDENGKATYKNPGFPFFVPGKAGHRAPHPPMDFAWKENPDGSPKLYTELTKNAFSVAGQPVYLNGGLPRHLVLNGEVVREFHSRWDFTKDTAAYDESGKFIAGSMTAMELPEQGTDVEQAAMSAHATRTHASYQPDGLPGNFILNGLPPVAGAPFAAPDVDDNGNSNFDARRYKAAVIQTDVVLNKEGWHYPQQRFITLLDDVKDTVNGIKPPEPFFFRSNTGETIEFWHTNLVPAYYELDDFQVRTPTDILGQHIHLVKFDVTSSDGAGNGFNYEDGTFSPDEVRDRINGINAAGGLYHYSEKQQGKSNQQDKLTLSHYLDDYPTLGIPPAGQHWDGAQTTVQRFDTDPLLNNNGEDRTLRTVFTHDHFGPSTHQQAGLYGALLVEPAGSTWKDAVTGCAMPSTGEDGCPEKRDDGGPTSWQALIETRNPAESYREFAIAGADLQLAYKNDSIVTPVQPAGVWFTINNLDTTLLSQGKVPVAVPPAIIAAFKAQGAILGKDAYVTAKTDVTGEWIIHRNKADLDQFRLTSAGKVYTMTMEPGWSDNSKAILPSKKAPINTTKAQAAAPYPTVISDPGGGGNIGTWVANYRNEPLDARVQTGRVANPNANANATDTAYAYQSIKRQNAAFNSQPVAGAAINPKKPDGFKYPSQTLLPQGANGVGPTDPYTPMLRAYAGDKVQVRTVLGAVDSVHSFGIQGVHWQAEPSFKNSGWRDAQGYAISEHFEMLFDLPPANADTKASTVDYLYTASSSSAGQAKGSWGLMRAYQGKTDKLAALPNNPQGKTRSGFYTPPTTDTIRTFDVTVSLKPISSGASIPLYTYKDCNSEGQCTTHTRTQLILRAAAGEWIRLTLTNTLPQAPSPNPMIASISSGSNSETNLQPYNGSLKLGFNPRLISYDSASQSGLNIGQNSATGTVDPGQSKTYTWYAGRIESDGESGVRRVPIEFGGVNLTPADPLVQASYGIYGALIVEPEGSQWSSIENHSLTATINDAGGNPLFTEIVVLGQVAGNATAVAGSEVRMRVLNPNRGNSPGSAGDNTNVVTIEGHNWTEEPFTENSRVIGKNPLSQTLGTQQIASIESYNMVLPSAGGVDRVTGKYDIYYYPKGPGSAIGSLTVTAPSPPKASLAPPPRQEGERP